MFLGKRRWSIPSSALRWMMKITNNGPLWLAQELERRHHTRRFFSQLFFADEDLTPVQAPSEQVEVKTTWSQIVEQAGRVAVTSPQAMPLFEQNRYQMAIEAAGVGVYDWDIASDQHFWSNECKALLGLPPDAQEDFAYYRSLIHPEDREQVFSLFSEHYYAKTPHKLEYRLVWPDGSLHWIVDHGRFLFDQQGNPVRLIGVTWDITVLKQAEEALSQANEQLREFFCQIGHELRTPLTALKGNLQLIERHLWRWMAAHESSLTEEEKLLLQRLRRWNERALQQANVENHLIENLLDASALQAAGLRLALEPCNLVQVVSAAVNDLQMVMPPRTLFYEDCEHADIPVMVDEARVGQVITQYVKNALPAATELSPIMVGISLGENAARVWVKDAGPGLSCEQQVSIWKLLCPASGLARSQCPGGSGLGLGLYLCRELIRLHRGQIGVESVPGEGSTFWFTLPLREM